MNATTVLQKLHGAVESRTDKAASGHLLSKVSLVLLGIAAVVVFAWMEWRRSRQIADLMHEKTVRLVEQANQRVAAANAADVFTAKAAKTAADAAMLAADEIDAKVASLEKAHDDDKVRIDSIRSWNDLVR